MFDLIWFTLIWGSSFSFFVWGFECCWKSHYCVHVENQLFALARHFCVFWDPLTEDLRISGYRPTCNQIYILVNLCEFWNRDKNIVWGIEKYLGDFSSNFLNTWYEDFIEKNTFAEHLKTNRYHFNFPRRKSS